MEDVEGYECYVKAGSIASKVRGELDQIVRAGRPIIEVCELVEDKIRAYGGRPAFPCNVSVNEFAAHYTSDPGDREVVPKGSLVKIDLGVEVDGYIADTATTLALGLSYRHMIVAVEEALETAVKNIRADLKIDELGGLIERVIRGYGFKPIENLCGHKMERFILHSGKSIPNVSKGVGLRLVEGEVYAVEPFLTTLKGVGKVVEGESAYIFRFLKDKGVKDRKSKRLLAFIKDNFRVLPFTKRWLGEWLSQEGWSNIFKGLVDRRCLHGYPVLVEGGGEPVSQAEHTVIVRADGCEVLTR